MSKQRPVQPETPKVVLGDANVLYSRVLRDFLLYSATEGIISITWSSTILDEVVEHLADNISGFNHESGEVLKEAMNYAYPLAQIDPRPEDYLRLANTVLPDEDDRHVLAAAIAADADIICTANTKDFPKTVTQSLGLSVMNPDVLLGILIERHPTEMMRVLDRSVSKLHGATNESTIAALRAAGANNAATLLEQTFAS
jgi:predicted nucleic acid-binding protein